MLHRVTSWGHLSQSLLGDAQKTLPGPVLHLTWFQSDTFHIFYSLSTVCVWWGRVGSLVQLQDHSLLMSWSPGVAVSEFIFLATATAWTTHPTVSSGSARQP